MKHGTDEQGRVLRFPEKSFFFAVFAALVLAGCATRPPVDSWGDASLSAEQRLVIEQQQERLNDMGEAVGRVQETLARAIDEVTASLDGTGDLESLFGEIDKFVRRVIESKRELENVQQPNSGTDAGER